MLGPPGSGKGTQGRLLAAAIGVPHLSVGALLRAAVASRSPLGARVAATIAAGDLVPVADVLAVLRAPLAAATRSGGWVLDGAPRTAGQASALDRMLEAIAAPVQFAIALHVPAADAADRLRTRALVEGRGDDTGAVIAHRLAAWERDGPAVLAWFHQRGILARVDGTGDVGTVAASVAGAVDRLGERAI